MKRIILLALAALLWAGVLPTMADRPIELKVDWTTEEWIKGQIALLKMDGFQITKKDAENFRKLDEFITKIDPKHPGRSTAWLARKLAGPNTPVLISRYINRNMDKLSSDKLYVLTAVMFGEDGVPKLKGFDADAYYRHKDPKQRKILINAGRREQQRMEKVIAKQEEVKQKISVLESARGALTQAVTSDGKFPIENVEEFFSHDAPYYVNQARQNGTYTDAAAHTFYGAYYGAKNTVETNSPVINANKDVSPTRLNALKAGLKELNACIEC